MHNDTKQIQSHDQGRFSTTSLLRPHRQNAKRACDACRSRKKKCSAEGSGCSNCRELNVACVYSDGKKELNSKYAILLFPEFEDPSSFD